MTPCLLCLLHAVLMGSMHNDRFVPAFVFGVCPALVCDESQATATSSRTCNIRVARCCFVVHTTTASCRTATAAAGAAVPAIEPEPKSSSVIAINTSSSATHGHALRISVAAVVSRRPCPCSSHVGCIRITGRCSSPKLRVIVPCPPINCRSEQRAPSSSATHRATRTRKLQFGVCVCVKPHLHVTLFSYRSSIWIYAFPFLI